MIVLSEIFGEFNPFIRQLNPSERTLILPAKIYELLKRMAGLGILNGMDLDNTQIKAYLPKKVWGLYEKEDYSYFPEIQYVFPDEDADTDAKMKKCDRIDLDKPYKTIAAERKSKSRQLCVDATLLFHDRTLGYSPPNRAPIIFRPNQNRLTMKAKLK